MSASEVVGQPATAGTGPARGPDEKKTQPAPESTTLRTPAASDTASGGSTGGGPASDAPGLLVAPSLSIQATRGVASPSHLSAGAAALLQSGGVVTAYVAEGSSSSLLAGGGYFTRLISLFYDGASSALYWSEPVRRETRPSHAIPLERVSEILVGKHSAVLQWVALSADPERCFTLRWGTGDDALDLECESEAQRADWLAVLDHLLTSAGKLIIEAPPAIPPDDEMDGPIDPISSLARHSHISASAHADADTRGPSRASASSASAAAATSAVAPLAGTPALAALPPNCFEGLAQAVDLDFSDRKAKRFRVVDRSSASAIKAAGGWSGGGGGGTSTERQDAELATLAATLRQFEQWMDAHPAQPPTPAALSNTTPSLGSRGLPFGVGSALDTADGSNFLTAAAAAAVPTPKGRTRASVFMADRTTMMPLPTTPSHGGRRPASTATSVPPKDDPRSLEGSLSKLGAGVAFTYCPRTDEAAASDHAAPSVGAIGDASFPFAAASSSSSPPLPGQPHFPRRLSFSSSTCDILLFYAPASRRATGRLGNFGQLSWCDSQVWTRKAEWKLLLHVDTYITLGKATPNFRRPVFDEVPSEKCFSIQNPNTNAGFSASSSSSSCSTSLDLICESGWPGIKQWLASLDRVLRSGGFTMVRQGRLGGGGGSTAGTESGAASSAAAAAGASSSPVRIVFVSQSELAQTKKQQPPVARSGGPSVAASVHVSFGGVSVGGSSETEVALQALSAENSRQLVEDEPDRATMRMPKSRRQTYLEQEAATTAAAGVPTPSASPSNSTGSRDMRVVVPPPSSAHAAAGLPLHSPLPSSSTSSPAAHARGLSQGSLLGGGVTSPDGPKGHQRGPSGGTLPALAHRRMPSGGGVIGARGLLPLERLASSTPSSPGAPLSAGSAGSTQLHPPFGRGSGGPFASAVLRGKSTTSTAPNVESECAYPTD